MSETEVVVCGRHGTTPVTFTCRHVAAGVACGFHFSAERPDDPWPDAWCDLCEERLVAAGDWTDEVAHGADLKILCTHCYEARREANRVPLYARGARAALTVDEAERLFEHATHEGQTLQRRAEPIVDPQSYSRWDFARDARVITFSGPTVPTRVADVRMVGSYSRKTRTFQWSWATYAESHPLVAGMTDLRAFGEVRGLSRLTTPHWDAEEVDAWEMAALAGYLLGCEGLYRAPIAHLYWFMLLANWRTAS